MIEATSAKSEKVVVQFGLKTIKGYLESPSWNTIEDLLSNAPRTAPETFRIRRLESDRVEEIPTREVKAVFYVNSRPIRNQKVAYFHLASCRRKH